MKEPNVALSSSAPFSRKAPGKESESLSHKRLDTRPATCYQHVQGTLAQAKVTITRVDETHAALPTTTLALKEDAT